MMLTRYAKISSSLAARFSNCKNFSILNRIGSMDFGKNIAITLKDEQYTYADLLNYSKKLAKNIKLNHGSQIKTIASFNGAGVDYVITMLAAWQLDATIVPLSTSHTFTELDYFIRDSKSNIVVTTDDFKEKISSCSIPIVELNRRELDSVIVDDFVSPQNDPSSNALILYTSGTTGKPKGVVHTHAGLEAMVVSLTTAWEYQSSDKILHFLPLHHLHGVLNKLICTLYAGGQVAFMKSANAIEIWKRLSQERSALRRVTMFMAVPTIYSRMLEVVRATREFPETAALTPKELDNALSALKAMRLMVSGSAALPIPVLKEWHGLTGPDSQVLLERFGMTEIGMGLSNVYHGERVAGTVGYPLPGVQVRLVDDAEGEISGSMISGELRVKGPTVFKEYLGRTQETLQSFDTEGWFRTGDVAMRDNSGRYVLLGRSSMDIIKSGGYKLSALEIEFEILSNPEILEAVVIGVPDEVFGQRVIAILKPKDPAHFQPDTLMTYLKTKLAAYKLPRKCFVVPDIPRNQLGKVNKKTIIQDLKLTV